MKLLGGASRLRKTLGSVAVLAVIAGVPVTFALLHDGFPVSDVQLNAKDVWVTNDTLALAGRLNRQIDELTAAAQSTSNSIDVVQDGAQVFLHDESQNTLERIERSRATLVQKTPVPAKAEISLGDTTMSIVDPATGKLWIINVANGLSFDAAGLKPDLVLGQGGHAVVGHDGAVYADSPSRSTLYTFRGAGALPSKKQLSIPTNNQLSVVGDQPVILAPTQSVLITGSGTRVDLHGKAMKIQQASAANGSALVATNDSLLEVPLGGGAPKVIQANVSPQPSASDVSAPVWLQGCDYGAWSGARMYVQKCGDGVVQRLTIQQQTQGDDLEFRVNKNVIALNNLQNGNVWVLSSKLKLVNNWDQVRPPVQSKTEKGHEKSTEDSFEDTLAHRTAVNHPPVARADAYGIRRGRTTILPVVDNDTDQDGDVLTISHFDQIPKSEGRIDAIDGGRALQFTPGSSTIGSESFHYTIIDGRGGSDEANVNLTVVSDATNHAPKEIRNPAVSVEAGQSITYDVLTDWTDPDGDDMILKSATPTSADGVQFTPDGFITFKHKSGELGNKTVNYTVSDGRSTTPGKLTVQVKADGSLTPVGTPDFAQIFAGGSTVIQPLLNDLSPSGKDKRLVSVSAGPASATVSTNLQAGTVSIGSSTPGTIYVTYKLATGSEQGEGIIRVDVKAKPEGDIAPIAVKDVTYLRADQSSTVKVLSNDVSPTGKVLSVQSVNTDNTDPGVKVQLLNNTIVRVAATGGLAAETQFTYTISDGEFTSVAGVTVVPVAPLVNHQPPVAVDDRTTVRAGDIVSVNVLANDYSPDQEQLSLVPKLSDTSDVGGGLAFTNGNTVRYEAPTKAGQYSVIYRVTDRFGETATARVTFVVTAINKTTDQPPAPSTQTARAYSGQTIRINVPLDGIDPDGDSSFLTGIASPPTLGSIVKQGPTWFDYKADASSSGSDVFGYTVADTFGAVGTGEIDVGVIPRPSLAGRPNAVNDTVEVKPGKTVSVQVLANDSDPNGYPLTLSKKLTDVSPQLDAHVTGQKVIIRASKKQGGYNLRYTISDGEVGEDYAYVNVRVTKLAKPMYPSATDDYIQTSQLHGNNAVKVDVEQLINNPNGEDSELLLSAEGPNAERAAIDQNNGTISVQPGAERYAVAYRVTDPTTKSLTATAFIVVPASGSQVAPYLKTTLPKQIVKMNSSRTWKLADILTVPSGKPAIITSPSTVKATHTDGSSAYIDKNTIKFTAAKNFRGSAVMVFQVTDGTSATDPKGQVAYITMPIVVGDTNSDDVPPSFALLKLPIVPGEKATDVDLRQSTTDPNRSLISQFTYSGLSGTTDKVQGGLSGSGGSTLSVSAPVEAQPGSTATLKFTIKYKNFTVPGQVDVTVVKSTRQLTQAVDDSAKGLRNVSITTNVLANDINPFADIGKPLKLTSANITNGATGSVSFTPSGNVTVSNENVGQIAIAYVVRDATNDPSRDVTGRYTLLVRDVPDQPDPPTIENEGDQAVTIGWQPPNDNFENLIDYTITTSPGGAQKTVDSSTAQTTLTGLTNGQNYTFQISARNGIGSSTISRSSAVAIPYGKPGAPTSPSITATSNGSGNVTMTWGSANANGRAVSSYTWRLSDGETGSTSGLSATSSGTKVGTAYTFTVHATNLAGAGADASSGGSATPRPGPPSSATTSVGAAGDSTVTMTWGSSPSNTAISKYEININNGGWTAATSPHTFGGNFGTAYSFQVRAYSGGQVSDATGSNSATPTNPQPTYSLCYGPPYQSGSVQHLVGVNYANIGGSHTLKLQGGFTSHTTIVGGTGQWVSASHIARQTSGDLNQTVTLLVDGNAALSERWGDAPPC